MKPLVFVSVSALLCMGCSHSRLGLHPAPAREGAAEDRRTEVTSRDRLSIDTRTDGDGEIKPVTVNPVAAEGRYLLASSRALKTVSDSVTTSPPSTCSSPP